VAQIAVLLAENIVLWTPPPIVHGLLHETS
jgi:hypothetical protein